MALSVLLLLAIFPEGQGIQDPERIQVTKFRARGSTFKSGLTGGGLFRGLWLRGSFLRAGGLLCGQANDKDLRFRWIKNTVMESSVQQRLILGDPIPVSCM